MKKDKRFLLVIILLATSIFGNAQKKRAAHWFFGYEAGLNFSTGVAVADTSGKLISIEGSATISDTLGNLLFYTNGQKIWDKNGLIMTNSIGMIGDESSAQSSIIIPKPGSDSLYYLFTTNGFGPNAGFHFNIVDMSLNSGSGDINASKNIFLLNSITEELAATRHCNGIDYWIVTRKELKDTLKLYAYCLNAMGISSPVISKIPTPIPLDAVVGGLTFSQDGSRLIHSVMRLLTGIEVLTFNNQTGQVTMQTNFSPYSDEQIYSNALSPDASKLYVTSWWKPTPSTGLCYLSEFDLSANNIGASRKNLDSVDFSNGSPTGFGFMGAVRLAPDKKIYVSRWNHNPPQIPNIPGFSLDSLGVINAPDLLFPLCNYQQNGFYLNQKPTQIGLPNFVSNFTSELAVVNTCPTTTVLGVGETYEDFGLVVYPNPFSDKTNLVFRKDFHSQIRVTFTDILGKTHSPIVTENPNGMQLEKSSLPSGIYYLTIWDDHKRVAQKKLILLGD